MKIENQVCTLEQAKRLKELGVQQESYFWHWKDSLESNWFIEWYGARGVGAFYEAYAAFTVAELGVMLPNVLSYKQERCIIIFQNNLAIHFEDEKRFLAAIIQAGFEQNVITRIYGETEAQARAAMLIYLLENNLITAAEVNKRLNER